MTTLNRQTLATAQNDYSRWRHCFVAAFLLLALSCASTVYADTFGSGANMFEIEFVTIGNPGNADDTTGSPGNPFAGSVLYEYRIGKFEISERMIDKANSEGGLGVTKDTRGVNQASDQNKLERGCSVRELAEH